MIFNRFLKSLVWLAVKFSLFNNLHQLLAVWYPYFVNVWIGGN
jgi:hypothetical protein